jgi:hypothetical protein
MKGTTCQFHVQRIFLKIETHQLFKLLIPRVDSSKLYKGHWFQFQGGAKSNFLKILT